MKNMLFGFALALLLFGCVAQQVPQLNETVENITMTEEKQPSDIFSVKSTEGKFPTIDYEFLDNSNPFSDGIGGDLGKTSTSYIKVGENDLTILAPGCQGTEKQTIWVTPMIKEGKGVLFEAVYSIELKDYCDLIDFMGKRYSLEILEKPETEGDRIIRGGKISLRELGSGRTIYLKDGTSLNNDDKWNVVLGWKNDRPVKILVYMGGYFYDIEADTDEVSLFGEDRTIRARFTKMYTTPTFELITTDTGEVKKN